MFVHEFFVFGSVITVLTFNPTTLWDFVIGENVVVYIDFNLTLQVTTMQTFINFILETNVCTRDVVVQKRLYFSSMITIHTLDPIDFGVSSMFPNVVSLQMTLHFGSVITTFTFEPLNVMSVGMSSYDMSPHLTFPLSLKFAICTSKLFSCNIIFLAGFTPMEKRKHHRETLKRAIITRVIFYNPIVRKLTRRSEVFGENLELVCVELAIFANVAFDSALLTIEFFVFDQFDAVLLHVVCEEI